MRPEAGSPKVRGNPERAKEERGQALGPSRDQQTGVRGSQAELGAWSGGHDGNWAVPPAVEMPGWGAARSSLQLGVQGEKEPWSR